MQRLDLVLLLFLASSQGLLASAQPTLVPTSVGQRQIITLPSGPTPFALTFSPPLLLNASTTLELHTRYADADEKADADDVPDISFVVLSSSDDRDAEGGVHSMRWRLSSASRSATTTFCLDVKPTMLRSLTLVADSVRPAKITMTTSYVDQELSFDVSRDVSVTTDRPVTFLVDPVNDASSSKYDRYVLKVEDIGAGVNDTSSEVCMIVAAYGGNQCPFKNNPKNVRNADMWQTVLEKGAMTLRYEHYNFNMPFYVSVIVLDTDDECHLSDYDGPSVVKRQKQVRVSIRRAEKYKTYVSPVLTSILTAFFLIAIAFIIMKAKRLGKDEMDRKANSEPTVRYSAQRSRESGDQIEISTESKEKVNGQDVTDNGPDDSLEPMVATPPPENKASSASPGPSALLTRCQSVVPDNSTRKDRINKGLSRLDPQARVSDMTRILEDDVWFRRNRSRVYCYLVPLLSLFYFIPSIQFVFLVKQSESMTGSQDLCYHNFQCAKPLNIFSDFNHVISNVTYVIYGLSFILLVRYKASRLPEDQKPKNDHKNGKGILQQLSIFYAMGAALFFQGFFSICYHVCPTNHSLQFDSTMMYVMCMLGIVKIYQFRHPDANANAYSFFYFLGGLVLLEALAIYSSSWLVYGAFLLFYVLTTLFIAIDCYFVGIGRLDRSIAKEVLREIFTRQDKTSVVRYPKRFGFAFLFCFVNLGYAAYVAYAKFVDPRKTVTHVVLLILAGNLFLYIIYYVFRKNRQCCSGHLKSCRARARACSSCCGHGDTDGSGGQDVLDARYSVQVGCCNVPIFMSAGLFFAISAVLLGGVASYFYLNRSANRNLSPAESRNLNEDCGYMGFFDNHDMWHFLSSAAIFMAFLALLTVDDDLLTVPRDQIEVF